MKGKTQSEMLAYIVRQVLIAVIMGCVYMVIMMVVNNVSISMSEEAREMEQYANEYRLASKGLTYNVQSYAVTGEQSFYEAYLKEINEDHKRENAIEGLKGLHVTDGQWTVIDQIQELSNGLVPLEEEAFAKGQEGKTEEAKNAVFGTEYQDKVTQINDLTDQVTSDMISTMSNRIRTTKIINWIIDFMMAIALVFLGYKIFDVIKFAKRELLAPIIKVEQQMQELAAGNLQAPFDMEPDHTEVGMMVQAIYDMKASLTDMIQEISTVLEEMAEGKFDQTIAHEYIGDFSAIRESLLGIISHMGETLQTIQHVADDIDQGSEQLASTATELAEGSSTQASVVQQLAASMEEMASSIRRNMEEARESVSIASQAGTVLAQGNEKMEELKSSIGEIEKRSEEISSIIETINEIASQTNLLALNAAIEAARAGEAGKGFAVVADQVKNLANESAAAANRTTALIEATVEAVNTGIRIADETGNNMVDVMKGAKQATSMMGNMVELLEKDVESIDEINQGINHVAQVVESNSAASEETAAVSEEQRSQVESMVEMMNHFQIHQ